VYSPENNPFTYQNTLEGIRTIVDGLTNLAARGSLIRDINEKLLLGALMADKSLSETEMGLHHKCAHVLGGSFGLNHAETHTVLLPYVFFYQWESLTADIKEDFRDLFSSGKPPRALLNLITKLGLPSSLKAIGFNKEHSKSAAVQIVQMDFRNPVPVTKHAVQLLLENA
jgi:alcohol dehydrogenase class IV